MESIIPIKRRSILCIDLAHPKIKCEKFLISLRKHKRTKNFNIKRKLDLKIYEDVTSVTSNTHISSVTSENDMQIETKSMKIDLDQEINTFLT